MPLAQVLFTLIVVGVVLWMINQFIPMANSIKSILNAIVVIGVCGGSAMYLDCSTPCPTSASDSKRD